jgi:2-oxoacid:acceptor oxidoreductase gamma subunit (pyruvate/2-ketoisovalerate family)
VSANGRAREVRFHGRGGQGVVLASKILARALVESDWNVSAIPAFGFERRGAPVAAYLRYAAAPIRAATNIYRPDYVLCIDPSVSRAVDIYAGLADDATLVQATGLDAETLEPGDAVTALATCDAVRIGLEIFGKPITNTVMLGAFARATGVVDLDALEQGLAEAKFRDAGLEQNLEALRRGHAETRCFRRGAGGFA